MSKICKSCGGVLGRDCFNEYECGRISMYQEQEAQQQIGSHEQRIKDLEAQVNELYQLIQSLTTTKTK
jgi:hypothetical protein